MWPWLKQGQFWLKHYLWMASKRNDELWNYCQSGKTVRIMGMDVNTATSNETCSIFCIQVSWVNQCDRKRVVSRNRRGGMGISSGFGWTHTGERNYYLQHKHVVASFKTCAINNLLGHRTSHPFPYARFRLPRTSDARLRFVWFPADGILAAIPN